MLYRSLLRPLLFRLPPETVHELALHTLSFGLRAGALRRAAASHFRREPFGALEHFGLRFANPIGLAAGFDKNGAIAPEMAALGFGFVEVGTVTHHAQPGNPRPRLFRLSKDRALINRAGFNNDGAAALAQRLTARRPDCVLGINIGKSRVVEIDAAVADYLASLEIVHPHADYIAVNVSSPNTPHLRELQQADRLSSLLTTLQKRNDALSSEQRRVPVPMLVKVSPDLEMRELEMIVDVARRAGVAGIIATNTTTSRAGLRSLPEIIAKCGEGGLSGAPLRKSSTQMIAVLHRLSGGALTIVGVGGIFNAADAWEKICAGASLVQLYTGLVYEGVGIARDINDGLVEIMNKEGFRTLDEAIGCRTTELAAA
ncbi:MAG TPA: quinone-dependent dihydroorotate dehydrogenase [Pyrinomonadaceae bacterium]|nr:quinone-dependent dihydroorotate dehydrogenase [Pyrinomonadaceae bacterium]